MADIRDINASTVSTIKVVDAQLEKLDLTLLTTDDVLMTELLGRVLTGTLLVEGQIIMLNTYAGITSLGSVPAIVTDVSRVTASVFKYDLTVILGELTNGTVSTISLEDNLLDTIVDTSVPPAVVDNLLLSKLGNVSGRDLLLDLNVPSLMTLDVANNSFNIVM